MKILTIYDTYTGTTEKCAQIISQKLSSEEVRITRVPKNGEVDFQDYDIVLIGSYVHAGKISRRISKFCKKNLEKLLSRRVGIFLCMLSQPENLEKYLKDNFDDELLQHAVAKGCFGSELNYEMMNPIIRFIIRQIVKKAQPEIGLHLDEIEKFVQKLKS